MMEERSEANDAPVGHPAEEEEVDVRLQRKDHNNIAERPDDWLGSAVVGVAGEGVVDNHKTKLKKTWMKGGDEGVKKDDSLGQLPFDDNHKTKLKSTWLHDDNHGDDEGMNQSLSHLSDDFGRRKSDAVSADPLHASESRLLQKPSIKKPTTEGRRQSAPSPLILQRLSLIKQKSEENHKANEFWSHHGGVAPADGPLVRALAASEAKKKLEKEKEKGLPGGSDHSNPSMSQSMRDQSSGATKLEDMNASDSQVQVRKGRRTSAPVKKHNADGLNLSCPSLLNKPKEGNGKHYVKPAKKKTVAESATQGAQQEEELQQKDKPEQPTAAEEQDVKTSTETSASSESNEDAPSANDTSSEAKAEEEKNEDVPATNGTSTEAKAKEEKKEEELRLQRKDHNNAAARPGDWLGGASEHSGERKWRRGGSGHSKGHNGIGGGSEHSPDRKWLSGGSGHSKEGKSVTKTDGGVAAKDEIPPSSPTTVKEDFRLQRKDHNNIATRPGDWLGGGSETSSPVPRTKAKRRQTTPFRMQNPLVQ